MKTMLQAAWGALGGTQRFGYSGLRVAGRLGLLIGAAGILCAVPAHAATTSLTPTYSSTALDYTWTWDGTKYSVPAISENHSQELWERGLQDNKWSVVNGDMVLLADGLYREYVDLSGAGFGYDNDYLYVYWNVVGDRELLGNQGSPTYVGLEGKYNFYFEVDGYDPFLVYVNTGTAVPDGPLYTDVTSVKLYTGTAANTYGTDIGTTCESTNCTPSGALSMTGFNTEVSGTIWSRRTSGDYRVEVAVPLSLLGNASGDLANLLWAYAGVAKSNPSGPNDLFANDRFPFAQGFGVEYDTLRFEIAEVPEPPAVPEPAALLLMGTGLVALSWRRRSKSASPRN